MGTRTRTLGALTATVVLATTAALGAPVAPSAAAGPDDVSLPGPVHGSQAVRALGADLDEAAALNGRSPAALRTLLLEDRTAWVDRDGRLFYVEPRAPRPAAGAAAPAAPAAPAEPSAPYAAADAFSLHSKPGSSHVIYLDFDGQVVSGTAWNDSAGAPTLDAAPFSFDGDASFSDAERAAVQGVWQRVAEDYAPFDVDVTTQDPGAAALERTSDSDQQFGTRAVITSDDEVWDAVCGRGCGGVAYVDVFDSVGVAAYQPAWVFTGGLFDVKAIAEATSHEVGHNFGLDHDGNPGSGYDEGHDPWAPIMGVGYYQPIVQWSRGEYAGATNTQDDVGVIAAGGAPFRADEAGSTPGEAATGLPAATAYVTSAADSDVYALGRCSGDVVLDARPAPTSPDLDIALTLLTADGTEVASADPRATRVDADRADGMAASLGRTLPAASYFVRVAGAANGDADTGYTSYGSIGAYTLTRSGSGTCAPVPTGPSAPTSVSATREGTSLVLRWAPPARDGGASVTDYVVAVDGSPAVTLPATARQYRFDGQDAGPHTLTVAARNSVGRGPEASAEVGELLPLGPPTSTSLRGGGGRVSVEWAVDDDYPVAQLTGWRLTPYVDGVRRTAITLPAGARSYETALTDGGEVGFDIAALSGDLVGEAASTGTVRVNVLPPSAPRIGTASGGARRGAVTATARWSAPEADNGSAVQRYQVLAYRLDRRGHVVRTLSSPDLAAGKRTAVLRLPAGRYRFAVRAGNAAGWGATSARSNAVRAR